MGHCQLARIIQEPVHHTGLRYWIKLRKNAHRYCPDKCMIRIGRLSLDTILDGVFENLCPLRILLPFPPESGWADRFEGSFPYALLVWRLKK